MQGLAKTRTADVAQKAGLSHGGIFVHFKTRDDLLTEAVNETARRLTARLHTLVTEDASLADVLHAHLAALSECEPEYSSFLRESRLLPEDTLRPRMNVLSVVSHYLNERADRAMQAGLVRPIPKHLLFNTWIGLVHHYLVNRELFTPGGSVLEERGEELVSCFMSLIRTSNGGSG